MADVCELAHERTVRDCRKERIQVNCDSEMKCGNSGQIHGDPDFTHYTIEAQEVFDGHYNGIVERTGL